MTSSESEIYFDSVVSHSLTELRVAYEVRNNGLGAVGLFNRIQSMKLDGTASYAVANTYINFEDGVLDLSKMVLPIPEGLNMTARIAPFITYLQAGDSYQEEFRLMLPIEVCQPMRRVSLAMSAPGAEVVANVPAQAKIVKVSVGMFRSKADWQFTAVSPAHPGVYRVWPPGPPVDTQIILTKTFQLSTPIAVLDYGIVGPV